MNYTRATVQQLMTIAYYDQLASLEDRLSAGAELKRRARRKPQQRIQQISKVVYPR